MSFGKITAITHDPVSKTASGDLKDIETGKRLAFKDEANIPDTDQKDVVNYTEANGMATQLTPNLSVRLHNLQTATQEVQDCVTKLLCAMAKDKNMTDVIAKKI